MKLKFLLQFTNNNLIVMITFFLHNILASLVVKFCECSNMVDAQKSPTYSSKRLKSSTLEHMRSLSFIQISSDDSCKPEQTWELVKTVSKSGIIMVLP